MKTLYFKKTFKLPPDDFWDYDPPSKESLIKEITKKFKLTDKPENWSQYDLIFDDNVSVNAADFLTSKLKEVEIYTQRVNEYWNKQLGFDIEKVEFEDDKEEEVKANIKSREDFGGWITHPASNLNPDNYYFKIVIDKNPNNGIIGNESYRGKWSFGAAEAEAFEWDLPYDGVVWFPKTPENLELFKKTPVYEKAVLIEDNHLVMEGGIANKTKIKDFESLPDNFIFANYIDCTGHYEKERKAILEELQSRKNKQEANKAAHLKKLCDMLEERLQMNELLDIFETTKTIPEDKIPLAEKLLRTYPTP